MVIMEPGEEEQQNKTPGTKLKDSIAGAMASLATESLVEGDKDASKENTSAKAKPKPQHKFLTRAGAAKRKNQESTLMTAVHQLALETNPDNFQSHVAILGQMLKSLEQNHHEYVAKEKLDINMDPEKSYMLDYERKVKLAIERQKKRLGILGEEAQSTGQGAAHSETSDLKQMEDDLNEQPTLARTTWAGSPKWPTPASEPGGGPRR